MKLLDFDDVLGIAVAHLGKPAVYVANHEVTPAVLMKFVCAVNRRYDARMCTRLINETFDEGLVVFDTAEECVDFYNIFDAEGIYGTGLMAIMYDTSGKRVCANVEGISYN